MRSAAARAAFASFESNTYDSSALIARCCSISAVLWRDPYGAANVWKLAAYAGQYPEQWKKVGE
jgi:hypothetical protein